MPSLSIDVPAGAIQQRGVTWPMMTTRPVCAVATLDMPMQMAIASVHGAASPISVFGQEGRLLICHGLRLPF